MPNVAATFGYRRIACSRAREAEPITRSFFKRERARLVFRGFHLGSKRVLRLMRTHGLLAPRRPGPPNGDPVHARTIITTCPDEMWGMDATRFSTAPDGRSWFFGVIDHAVNEIVGGQTTKIGDR